MKLSDYVARRVADGGITQVFMMTGGGAIHLNDSFGYEPRLRCLFNHHEQACAIAAEGYARVGAVSRPCLNVTAGPGGVNALTGVYGASGRSQFPCSSYPARSSAKRWFARHPLPGLRQLGDQEIEHRQHGEGHHEIRRRGR